MLSDEVRKAVTELARAVLSVRPLVRGLGSGVRIPAGPLTATEGGDTARTAAGVLAAVTAVLAVPELTAAPEDGDRAGVFERVVAERLDLPALAAALAGADPAEAAAEAARIAAAEERAGFDRYRCPEDAVSSDGARLPVYAAGDPFHPAVVLASAAGMPAPLCEPWLDLLARDHRIITWESRGLFGTGEDFDALNRDTAAQAADLFAVMDHCGVERAHVMGFCGGSVIALAAAGTRPERIGSLSLWHGAYELGDDCPKADHHRNMQALMALAAEDRTTAAGVHSVFVQTMLGSIPPGMAHLVLYPYATPELFYRYCRVNGPITDIDVRPLLDAVKQPVMVVTSEDDRTADPAGSRWVAGRLPDAELRVEPHGDHISLFTMSGGVSRLAQDFLARTHGKVGDPR